MLKNLKRKLYVIFISSIMLVFTIVFILLTCENIKTMQNAELSDVKRQATNLILLFENSSNYVENMKICETKYDYAFRLFSEQNELLYESNNIENTAKTIDTFLKIQKSSELIDNGENESNHSFQSGTITFSSEKGKTYYGVLCSIYTDTGYVNLVIVKEKSKANSFLPAIIRYVLIWFIVLITVLLVSILIIRQAMKPAEKAMKSQKDFIAAVSHELKTPLAVILSAADTIETLPSCDIAIQNQSSIIGSEVSRMTRLIHDLLLLSSIDAGNWVFHKSEIDVDTILINLYDKFVNICNQKSIDLQIKTPEECFPSLISDEDRLIQIVSILLDNAISYSPANSTILLDASIQKNHLTINIIDHGMGITDFDKKHIFDRFYRCDKSRTQKGHYGLGLSIASELITLLDGKIYLEDTPDGGCTFSVLIPWNTAENRK